jgi:hypothetical protein
MYGVAVRINRYKVFFIDKKKTVNADEATAVYRYEVLESTGTTATGHGCLSHGRGKQLVICCFPGTG